jgi:hypothetical protein
MNSEFVKVRIMGKAEGMLICNVKMLVALSVEEVYCAGSPLT